MPTDPPHEGAYIDANGCLTEVVDVGDLPVVVHYDDIPESDITTVQGVRCTTPIRTVIDIAPSTPESELRRIVQDCLGEGLFTLETAATRLAQPDMTGRHRAQVIRRILFPQADG